MMNIFSIVKGFFTKGDPQAELLYAEAMKDVQMGISEETTVPTAKEIGKQIFEEAYEKGNGHKLVSVSRHTKENHSDGNKYIHTATVVIEGDFIDIAKLVGDVAIEVGYHPAGYSAWKERIKVIDLAKGIHEVSWWSFNTCD